MLLQPPHLTLGPAPELGRIEDDAVIALAPAHLARGELGGVVDDPADRPLIEAAKHRIGPRLRHRFLRGIHMRHRAKAREGLTAHAGIAEKVERAGLMLALQHLAHPAPHRSHIGKETEVAKGGAIGGEAHFIAPAQLPAIARHALGQMPARDLRAIEPAPAAIFIGTGHEFAMRAPIGKARAPQRLPLGPDEAIAAIALELAPVAAIEQRVIAPALACKHQRLAGESGHRCAQSLAVAWAVI